MSESAPVAERDLHAYVDGELPPDRHREVQAWLAEHPDAAAQVADYQRLNRGLNALFAPALSEPQPPLRSRGRWTRRLADMRVAAAVAWLAAGGAVGWFVHDHLPGQDLATVQLTQNLVRPAAFAHVVYSSEVAHPVEVTVAQEQHLIAWLSKRLKTSLRAPSLIDHGYQLMGGRLLPSTDRMAAQFMYQDARGQRITLYVRRGAWESETSAFRYSHDDGIGTFYWIEGPVGYALSGEIDRVQLLALAETIYQQLTP